MTIPRTSEPYSIGTRRRRAKKPDIFSVNLTELFLPEDFQITTDVRVTGDRLWLLLLRFRRWLVEKPREAGHPWSALLTDIRLVAFDEGLRPEGIRFPWIVAPLPYYHPYRRDSALCAEPFGDDDYVLVTSGPDPICTRHYVYDEFGRAKRNQLEEFSLAAAHKWVEGWMHCRERQLCMLPPATNAIAPTNPDSNSGEVQTTPKHDTTHLTAHDFVFTDAHLTILAELAAFRRAMKATELERRSGLPNYETLLDRLNEMAAAAPALVARPRRNSGYTITEAGLQALRERDLLP